MVARTSNVCCAVVWLLAGWLGGSAPAVAACQPTARAAVPTDQAKLDAAALMTRALTRIRALRAEKRIPIDPVTDPNGTGIIGDEFSPLTTSLGEVDAKRTSATPAFAAIMVGYFRELGLRRGDVVAVGASGSFPGLALATLCAARALDLEPIVIYSVGASMYGANLPGFTFVDMLDRLRMDGVLPYRLAAVSPGGSGDTGGGVLFDENGGTLVAEASRSGVRQVQGRTLDERIADRLRIFDEARGDRPIRAFVNIGGSSAGYGSSEASLSIPNGVVRAVPKAPPPGAARGLVFEFASRGIPVVHLLFVRGLARDNHVPYDPVPLPPVGVGEVYNIRPGGQ